jgi:site-specific recombinase XerD
LTTKTEESNWDFARLAALEARAGAVVVFTSEPGALFSTHGYAMPIERLSVSAGFDFPHMLRHACGYALTNQGQ